jgi:cytochrome c556
MRFFAVLFVGLLVASNLFAADVKPEEQLKMRQGLMQAVKFQFGPVGAFAQGKGPLPADAADRAVNLAVVAKIMPLAWGKGGEDVKGSNTKAEAFTSAKFLDGFMTLGAATDKLADAARSGNADAVKSAAGGIGKACKGCHDDFRKDD